MLEKLLTISSSENRELTRKSRLILSRFQIPAIVAISHVNNKVRKVILNKRRMFILHFLCCLWAKINSSKCGGAHHSFVGSANIAKSPCTLEVHQSEI